jgi:hypothetical protein
MPFHPSPRRMTASERAVQVWQVLIAAAHQRQTLTYSMLAVRIGVGAHQVAESLSMVGRYCAARQFPPLTVLVVQADVGRPVAGFRWASDVDYAREAVLQHPWFTLLPPSARDFAVVDQLGIGDLSI